jgi:hypothetical protein
MPWNSACLTPWHPPLAKTAPAEDLLASNGMGDAIKGNFGAAGAVLSSIDAIKDLVGGLFGVLDFPPPLVAKNRPKEWTLDSEWGRQVGASGLGAWHMPCICVSLHGSGVDLAYVFVHMWLSMGRVRVEYGLSMG